MLIIIPTRQGQVVAKAEAGVWKPVRCLYCGAEFVYRMTRTAKGAAPVDFGNQAGPAAEWDARANAQLKLLRECDAVPCPDCGLYQENMVRMLKVRRLRRFLLPGLWLLAAGLLWFFFLHARRPDAPAIAPEVSTAVYACTFGAGLLSLVAGAVAWRFHRPNSGDPSARTRAGPPGGEGPYSRMEFEAMRDQMAAQGYSIGMILPPLSLVFGKPDVPRVREFHPPVNSERDEVHPPNH